MSGLNKPLMHRCKQYRLVLVKGRWWSQARQVSADLTESVGSPQPFCLTSLWSDCLETGSASIPTLVLECTDLWFVVRRQMPCMALRFFWWARSLNLQLVNFYCVGWNKLNQWRRGSACSAELSKRIHLLCSNTFCYVETASISWDVIITVCCCKLQYAALKWNVPCNDCFIFAPDSLQLVWPDQFNLLCKQYGVHVIWHQPAVSANDVRRAVVIAHN